jgi:hypothetical protein
MALSFQPFGCIISIEHVEFLLYNNSNYLLLFDNHAFQNYNNKCLQINVFNYITVELFNFVFSYQTAAT